MLKRKLLKDVTWSTIWKPQDTRHRRKRIELGLGYGMIDFVFSYYSQCLVSHDLAVSKFPFTDIFAC